MSSRKDVKKWMILCKHMREAIIDEQKAVPDYEKLEREATILTSMELLIPFKNSIQGIIADEKRHKRELLSYFDSVCPRMAFHRDGIRENKVKRRRRPRRDIEITDEDSMIQADYDWRHRPTFTD